MAVKVAGICCVIKIGTLGAFLKPAKNFISACGPPVDEPINKTFGARMEPLRKLIGLPSVEIADAAAGAGVTARTLAVAAVGRGRAALTKPAVA